MIEYPVHVPNIALIHPSRGRAHKAHWTWVNWMDKAPLGTLKTNHYLSIDEDDPQVSSYKSWACDKHPIVSKNVSVVQATNVAASRTHEDILIYLSDDFDCPDGWVELIEREFDGVTKPMLLKVDDCLQNFNVPVLTCPIMNRALYERLGYFWHPEYKSMFVDEDLYWTCKNNGWLKLAPHLKFPHNHVSIGKAPDDETYRRSAANWDQGKAVFARRKKEGFPL